MPLAIPLKLGDVLDNVSQECPPIVKPTQSFINASGADVIKFPPSRSEQTSGTTPRACVWAEVAPSRFGCRGKVENRRGDFVLRSLYGFRVRAHRQDFQTQFWGLSLRSGAPVYPSLSSQDSHNRGERSTLCVVRQLNCSKKIVFFFVVHSG